MSCCCCCFDAFFFLFLLSFLTTFMASTQNLTCLYYDCPYTATFDNSTTSTPPSPAASLPGTGRGVNYTAIVVAISVPVGVIVLLFIICSIAMRTKRCSDTTTSVIDGDDIATEDSLQIDFRTIQAATHDFSESNKLGEGGFGEVYKGTPINGVDIAVKRLAKSSALSEEDFKNEVLLLAKLQNRNLVRLLGFCVEGEERIHVYECLPNKSLDLFLFDPAKKGQLNWDVRYKIIVGIARGILYLHQDWRLTFIHSNLKESNILWDTDMNPKLADIGLARLFGMEKRQEHTSRIVGNRVCCYMFPEFAMRGQVSMKSDVYSSGVLLLEIISGRNNNSFHQTDDTAHDLITYGLEKYGTPLELVDPAIGDDYQRSVVIRCIQIGLLCVQEDHVHCPTFSTIVLMLTRNTITLPELQQLDSRSAREPRVQCCADDDAFIANSYPR